MADVTDYYHWRTGGGKHHKGGPHPERLTKAAAKMPGGPRHPRPHGRTLAQAIHYNNYLSDMVSINPMMAIQVQPVAATRVGKRAPLVAGPRRARRS